MDCGSSITNIGRGFHWPCVGVPPGLRSPEDSGPGSACGLDCKLRTLIEKAGDVVWTVDMSMRPTYISPSIQRHLGYTADEAMSLPMDRVFAAESYVQAIHVLTSELLADSDRGADPDRSRLLRVDLVHKDGVLVPFEIHCSALRNADGKPREIIAVARDITARRAAEDYVAQSARKALRGLEQTVGALAVLGEMRDSYTAAHQRRVADLACAIAEKMGMDEDALQGVRLAGLVHDIGKVRVPAEILTRPGRLSPAEMDIIRTHPAVGHEVLSGIDFPWAIAETVYQHHERLDGSGYPQGLMGSEIIPEARVLAVADVVEAIASDRPYRPALGASAALSEVSCQSGRLYDADVVDACLALFNIGYSLQERRAAGYS